MRQNISLLLFCSLALVANLHADSTEDYHRRLKQAESAVTETIIATLQRLREAEVKKLHALLAASQDKLVSVVIHSLVKKEELRSGFVMVRTQAGWELSGSEQIIPIEYKSYALRDALTRALDGTGFALVSIALEKRHELLVGGDQPVSGPNSSQYEYLGVNVLHFVVGGRAEEVTQAAFRSILCNQALRARLRINKLYHDNLRQNITGLTEDQLEPKDIEKIVTDILKHEEDESKSDRAGDIICY